MNAGNEEKNTENAEKIEEKNTENTENAKEDKRTTLINFLNPD